jgi:hypothetical protein
MGGSVTVTRIKRGGPCEIWPEPPLNFPQAMSEAARGGQLRAVWVPQPEDVAIRDLAQARNHVLLGSLRCDRPLAR